VLAIHVSLTTSNSKNSHTYKAQDYAHGEHIYPLYFLYTFLLWSASISSNTNAIIVPRPQNGSKVTPTICLLTLLAFFHLFHCFAFGAIQCMIHTILNVGYAYGFGGSGLSYTMCLNMLDMLKKWCSNNVRCYWRQKSTYYSNKVYSQLKLNLVNISCIFSTSSQSMTYFCFVHFTHLSISYQQNEKFATTSQCFP